MADRHAAKLTLPKGKAVYPFLNSPDYQFDELGVYQTRLSVPVEEAKPIMDKIASFFEDYAGKKLNPSDNTAFKLEEDDQGERTGNVVFRVKAKNRRTKSGEIWDRKPRLVDAGGQPTKVHVGGGSTIRIGCEMFCWEAAGRKGVSLQPLIIQVINPVSDSSNVSLEEFGIEVEDGYKATEDEVASFVAEPEADEVLDHDDF